MTSDPAQKRESRPDAAVERGFRGESRARETGFRAVYESAPIGIANVDVDGRFVQTNRAFRKMLGYTEDELGNMTFEDVTHPEDVAESREVLAWLVEGGRDELAFEKRYNRKDGRQIWCRLTVSAIRDASGAFLYTVTMDEDITERKRAERELQESEERYRVVAETASDGIIMIDEDSRILFTNSATGRIFGYPGEELIGQPLTMLMPEYLRHVHEASLKRYIDTGERHLSWDSIELPGLHGNGQEIPLEVSFGEFVKEGRHFFTGFIRDVSERKRTEDNLRASEERLSRIVETNADGIVMVDRHGRITFANAAAEKIFGLERGGITARTYDDPQWKITTVDGDPFPEEGLPFARVVGTGKAVYGVELALERPDGSRAILSVNGAPLRDAEGNVTGMVASFGDITERKRAEEELRRRDAISEAVRFAAERLLRQTGTWEEGVQEALERLGQATGVSRVYVFENYTGDDGEVWATNTHEWVARGVSAQIDNPTLQALPYKDPGFSRWGEAFGRGETLHGHVRDLPEAERPEPESEGTLSYVLVPVFVEGEWWGFMGIDECAAERDFSTTELDALKAAADTLGAAIGRNRMEQTLRRSRKKYKDLVNSLEGIVWEADAQSVEFSFVSEQAERLLGYPTNRWISEPTFRQEHIHPDDREWAVAFCARATAEKRDHELEYRMTAADGRVVWLRDIVTVVIENGEPVKLRGVMVDITERKRAEEGIEESRRALTTLMSNLPGMAYRCRNDSDWTMELVSEGSLELTGHAPDDLVGNRRVSYGDLIHPDDRERVWEKVQSGIEERRPFQFNYRITTVSGEVKWVWEQGRGVFSPGGELLAVEGFITDVTDRVQARELLEQRVEERTRELSALLDVSNNVASTLKLDPLLGLILDQLKTVVDYVDSSLLVVEDDELMVLEYRGPIPREKIIGEGFPLGPAMRTIWRDSTRPEPIVIDDILGDEPLARAYRETVGEERLTMDRFRNIRSWLGVPLVLKGRFIGLLAIIHTQPSHYTKRHAELAITVANQAAIAIENARLYEQAQGTAALEERQRLARELHDSVSQALYGIALGSKTARTLLDRDPSRVAGPLDYVLSLAEAGLAEMRALIFELRPESLENEGLIAALEKQAAALRARHEIPVRVTIHCEEPKVPLKAKEALYRIAQEALHNTIKHAQASSVELKLECGTDGITLEISDDGAGFDPSGDFPGHLGLHSM
ncbi:MAG: PAS domain S-box protein, partial [Rubrobacteraceae bacterium]